MKAIVLQQYGSSGVLDLQEVPRPTPKADEVLIKVHAASVNDWDWGLMRGKPLYIRLLCGLVQPKIKIPGVDIAGHVEAVGEEVQQFRPGDEVYGDLSESGFGGFAEYVCAPETALGLKPASMSFLDAAAIPHAGMLAIQGLHDLGRIEPGQEILINGAGGGVGTLGVQIAKAVGVKVTGVDHTSKLELMRSIGFDRVIDYTREDFTRGDRRYDLILDTKSNRSVFHYSRALKPGGLYVTVGGATARLLQVFSLGPLVGMFGGKKFRVLALKPNKDLARVSHLYESGKIEPVIEGPFSLDKVPDAIHLFGEGRHIGKVIIEMDQFTGPIS